MRIFHQEQRLFTKVRHLTKVQCSCNRLYTGEPWLWHVQLGHLSFDVLRWLEKMVRGLLHIEHVGELCDSCLVGK